MTIIIKDGHGGHELQKEPEHNQIIPVGILRREFKCLDGIHYYIEYCFEEWYKKALKNLIHEVLDERKDERKYIHE